MGPTKARVPEWDVGLTPLGDKLGDFSDEVQATGRLGQTQLRAGPIAFPEYSPLTLILPASQEPPFLVGM